MMEFGRVWFLLATRLCSEIQSGRQFPQLLLAKLDRKMVVVFINIESELIRSDTMGWILAKTERVVFNEKCQQSTDCYRC